MVTSTYVTAHSTVLYLRSFPRCPTRPPAPACTAGLQVLCSFHPD